MTQNQAKKLIKIGKILLTILFVIFFVVICVQSVKINNLKTQQVVLENNLTNKINYNNEINNNINNIENNFDKYSEEELRKDDFVKENEEFFTN